MPAHMTYQITEGPRPVSMDEKAVGTRAQFHVFYRNAKGKLFFDPAWADTPEGAVAHIQKCFRSLRLKNHTITCVHRITGTS